MAKGPLLFISLSLLSVVLLLSGCTQQGAEETTVPEQTIPQTVPTTTIPRDISYIEEQVPYPGSVVNAAVVGGKLVYAVRNAGETLLVGDGTVYVRENRIVNMLSDVGGKLAYSVSLGMAEDGKSIIVYDGKEMGREYFGVDYPTDVGGNLAYLAFQEEEGNMKSYVVYDGAELGKEYDNVASLSSAGGKPLFIGARGDKKYVVYDGKEYGGEYSMVSSPVMIDGVLAYAASNGDADGRRSFVVYGGKASETLYYGVEGLASVNGKLAYKASLDANRWVLVYDEAEVPGDYSYVKNPVGLGGALGYAAGVSGNENAKEYVVYAGKKSPDYDFVMGPFVADGVVVFLGERGETWYTVRAEPLL